jgi:hypothetical protein
MFTLTVNCRFYAVTCTQHATQSISSHTNNIPSVFSTYIGKYAVGISDESPGTRANTLRQITQIRQNISGSNL